MSFGFSVGDFITVIELANKIRKEFVDAPSQFKAISDEVRSLSIILLDVEVVLSDRELRNEQEAELKQIANGCGNVLDQLEHTLDEYDELKSGHGSVSKRVKRMWKRLKWEPEDIKQLRSRISTNIGLLNAFTSRLTRDNVVTLVRSQEDQGRQTILDWITPIDYALQQSDFISRRQAGTGQWLLDSAEFKVWVETDKRTLFCPGIPGAGKTILTSIVVEELFMQFENDGNIGIAYLYCNYRQRHDQTLEDLFASLLKQFVQEQPFIPDNVKTLYDRHKDKRTRPSFDEILGILQTVAAAYSRVFIIVDALDECQISDGCQQRFLSGLFNLQATCRVNLFATSRPISRIEKEFEGNSKLEIRASEEDVRRYLENHMFRLPGFVARSLELQEEIKTDIANTIDGMFLLAQLHLESLTGKRSPKGMRAALKNLATGSEAYDHAYEDAMERINGQIKDQAELAKQVLSWITCAKRQLTTTELQHALGVEVGESELDEENFSQIEDIVSVCAGLVTIDEESGIIRLVHYTTQEYFERTQKQWFSDAQINITTICVSYLSFDQFESGICQNDEKFEQRLQSNKLYDYAVYNWGHHAREASKLIPEVISFLERKDQVEASSQGLLAKKRYSSDTEYSQRFPKNMTGLHLAAYFGLGEVILVSLKKGHDLDSKDSHSRTPLSYTAGNGHEGVVKLLLEKGAELETKDKDNGRTPLSYTAGNGHEAVVKLLLEKGAELETKDKDNGRTPLSYTAGNGHEAVVKLLLEKGAQLETKDKDNGRTPLSYAAGNGHEAVVKLLLEKGAQLETKDKDYGQAPLSYAAENGHEAVVKLLLEKGAQLETKDKDNGRTPLLYAAGNGHEAVVKLLVEKGAELESKDKSDQTPLSKAALMRREVVVKLLLEKGAELESKDNIGRTPLFSAAGYQNEAMAKLLLERGAELESRDILGLTPLLWATTIGREAMVKLLLERGADLECKDEFYGRTPLTCAVMRGNDVVVKLLLEKGAELESKDNYGRTPLSWAAGNEHDAVVRLLLLTKGANPESEDNYGRTPLTWAVMRGNDVVVKLLLEKGAELESKNNYGRTPLSQAAEKGNEVMVKLLLEKGAELESKDNYSRTPLSRAAGNGHDAVVKLLLKKGAELESKDNIGQTPLSWATWNELEVMVKLLLEKGAELESKNNYGRTPLSQAAEKGNEVIVKLLLEKGAELESKDNYGRTPLTWAVMRGNDVVVKLLLAKNDIDPNHKDNFGLTPLFFAAKKGYPDIARFLLRKCRENDVVIRDEDISISTLLTTNYQSNRVCDICVSDILDAGIHYHCRICNGGDFDVCLECIAAGFLCLDHSHKLVKCMVKDGTLVEL